MLPPKRQPVLLATKLCRGCPACAPRNHLLVGGGQLVDEAAALRAKVGRLLAPNVAEVLVLGQPGGEGGRRCVCVCV